MAVYEHRLASTEIAALHVGYRLMTLQDTVITHFLNTCEDRDIRDLLKGTQRKIRSNLDGFIKIMQKDHFPIPDGFRTDADLDASAPRLYSDHIILRFVKQMGIQGSKTGAFPLEHCVRPDTRKLFSDVQTNYIDMFNHAYDLMLDKHVVVSPPVIPQPEKVEYVQDPDYAQGLLGKPRPLNCTEIAHLFSSVMDNAMGKVMLLGLSQVTGHEKLKKYLWKGYELAAQSANNSFEFLKQDGLGLSVDWDSEVTDSKHPPFSDKLMANFNYMLLLQGFINFGAAIAVSPRTDLQASYSRFSIKTAKYAKEGLSLLIENGWLERIPESPARKDLVKSR